MRSYGMYPDQPRHSDNQEIQAETVLSIGHILDSWQKVDHAIDYAKSHKEWSKEDLEQLPAYIPGLPLAETTYTPEELDAHQPEKAIATFKHCLDPSSKHNPLPRVTPFQLNFHGKEAVLHQLPQYLLTNSTIIVSAAYDAISPANPAAAQQKAELLDTIRKIDKLCCRLTSRADQFSKLLAKAQKLYQEPAHTQEFKKTYHQLQSTLGLMNSGEIATGSYLDILDLMKPHIETLEKLLHQYHQEIATVSTSIRDDIQQHHKIDFHKTSYAPKKTTLIAIATIATTIAAAAITSTQCNDCTNSENNSSIQNK